MTPALLDLAWAFVLAFGSVILLAALGGLLLLDYRAFRRREQAQRELPAGEWTLPLYEANLDDQIARAEIQGLTQTASMLRKIKQWRRERRRIVDAPPPPEAA